MKRRDFLGGMGLGLTGVVGSGWTKGTDVAADRGSTADREGAADREPGPQWNRLPRWRGFNLLEKFMQPSGNRKFVEDDFRMIHDWGFDFVRLPMDYRNWIVGGDWEKMDETVLKEIDEAVEFGERYGIHVCMNFHRAPGYTVARPPEPKVLWTDPDARRVCALHWSTFARRWRDVPNRRLSFNLFNEPADVPMDSYVETVRFICDAVREQSPERLIICDGTSWGMKPCLELIPLKVAQATRGYTPMEISHYRASWVDSGNYPTPRWPMCDATGMICGSFKPKDQKPLRIVGDFPATTRLRMKVGSVSTRAILVVSVDGKDVFGHEFVPGPEKGFGEGGTAPWEKVVYEPTWKCYQNVYNTVHEVEIPAGTKSVEIHVTEGDWLCLREIGLRPVSESDSREASLELRNAWGVKTPVLEYDAGKKTLVGGEIMDRNWLWEKNIVPWKKAESAGLGVMVGEFGAYRFTPHDVAMAWLEDQLANWKRAGWGWAMWNFRGEIGILDSHREDVRYEDFHGLKLDRAMLELLQKY
ncbi:MAG: cellulase family glycosylhydrolase [Planctomycetia bacterium]|nr:cellulase family glycosylhydrolase [Planctomycetia bacterium]